MMMNEYVTQKLRELDEERLSRTPIAVRAGQRANDQRSNGKPVIGPALRVAGRTLRRMGAGQAVRALKSRGDTNATRQAILSPFTEVIPMRSLRINTALLVLGACLALLAMACADSSEATQVVIESPVEGATVQSPVELTMSANGTRIGTPDTGNRHFHVYVDGSSDYEIVYDTSTSIELSPGQHTIEVILAEPNHEETSTTASVTVQVSGGEPTSPTPSGEAPDSGDGFGYG